METPQTYPNPIPPSPFPRAHPVDGDSPSRVRTNITDMIYGSPSLLSPLHRPNYARMRATPAPSNTSNTNSANSTPPHTKPKSAPSHVSMQMINNSIRKRFGNATVPDAVAGKLLHVHLDHKGLRSLLPLPITTDSYGKPVLSKALQYLAKCPSLSAVYLDHNDIHNLQGLSLLSSVTALHLQQNKLRDTLDIADMRGLRWLYLSQNPLHTVHMPMLTQCEELHLAHCTRTHAHLGEDAEEDAEGSGCLFGDLDMRLRNDAGAQAGNGAGSGLVAGIDAALGVDADGRPLDAYQDTVAGPPSAAVAHVQLTPETVFALADSLRVLDMSGCGLERLRDAVRVRPERDGAGDHHGDGDGEQAATSEADMDAEAEAGRNGGAPRAPPLLLAALHALRTLNLSHNRLSDLAEVVQLCRACGALEELDLSDNPVSSHPRLREMCVMLCPRLHALDGKPVLPSERAFYFGQRQQERTRALRAQSGGSGGNGSAGGPARVLLRGVAVRPSRPPSHSTHVHRHAPATPLGPSSPSSAAHTHADARASADMRVDGSTDAAPPSPTASSPSTFASSPSAAPYTSASALARGARTRSTLAAAGSQAVSRGGVSAGRHRPHSGIGTSTGVGMGTGVGVVDGAMVVTVGDGRVHGGALRPSKVLHKQHAHAPGGYAGGYEDGYGADYGSGYGSGYGVAYGSAGGVAVPRSAFSAGAAAGVGMGAGVGAYSGGHPSVAAAGPAEAASTDAIADAAYPSGGGAAAGARHSSAASEPPQARVRPAQVLFEPERALAPPPPRPAKAEPYHIGATNMTSAEKVVAQQRGYGYGYGGARAWKDKY